MAKRDDIKSILVIGAGPIVIGQACEFDYSGTQACKALREEGYRIILINSNPATIMTDRSFSDATYIEPIEPSVVEKIIAKERPCALLPTMGGQTALNTALTLAHDGVLEKYNVEMIGANAEAIEKAEDRLKFKKAMTKIGLEIPESCLAHSLSEALACLDRIGLPAIIRPSFTLGGTGGGIAYTKDEFVKIVSGGLEASPVNEILIEESVLGWKEYEMEVVRDKADNAIIICSIENIDTMGVHTGDSITVAPALTLSDKEYQIMRSASIAVLREIGVETGGSNVQFACHPKTGRMCVIEMNPRVSRSSALASKATGFPIAKVAAKLAVGYTLDEISNDITGNTPASFEPTIDYVVTKIPRFTFEKFRGTDTTLTTSMKSIGEVMAIGRSFKESIHKALRGLETGLSGFDPIMPEASPEEMESLLARPTPERLLATAQALRLGFSVERICKITGFDPWYIRQIAEIVAVESEITKHGLPENCEDMTQLKAMGFSDARLAQLAKLDESSVASTRRSMGVTPVYKRIDTCAAEFASCTPYLYSTYEHSWSKPAECEAEPSDRKKIAIIGGGPNRIGQGIEFDYCCCQACFALSDAGFETIMINCNPETVSTDYDTSDRLYFEPLTSEDVIELLRVEQRKGELLGVIIQFGGQTPLKIASSLQDAGIPILGTSVDSLDLAEDRERFANLVDLLGLKQPANGLARSLEEALEIAQRIGYPVLLRPSYVLGGRAMELVDTPEQLKAYANDAVIVSGKSPVLIDHYLRDAVEVDVDALSDGEDVFVSGIMEHIEEAGVHSGDSACTLPPRTLSPDVIKRLEEQTNLLAKHMKVRGLMNVQYAIKDDEVYLLEVNPRASRTVPFVAKATGIPVAGIASQIMSGEKLSSFGLKEPVLDHIAVKEAVFPFRRFSGSDPILGPEMKSTGEVMGIDNDFITAYLKSQIAAGVNLPTEGCIFISVKDQHKEVIVDSAHALLDMGFQVMATHGTANYMQAKGLKVDAVNKVREGSPHIVDEIARGRVQMIINTTETSASIVDSYTIRATALEHRIPCYTTITAGRVAIQSLHSLQNVDFQVTPLQDYYKRLTAKR